MLKKLVLPPFLKRLTKVGAAVQANYVHDKVDKHAKNYLWKMFSGSCWIFMLGKIRCLKWLVHLKEQ